MALVCIALANAHGLHARPAKILAQLAKNFDGDLRVRIVDGPVGAVSVKSLSKLLSLGARRGQVLEFVAEPTIAGDALPALLAAVEEGLGEEVEPLPTASAQPAVLDIEPVINAPLAGSQIQAIAAAPGIAIGPAHIQVQQVFEYPLRGESAVIERQRLQTALTDVRGDIQGLIERNPSKAIREIFITHQEMLDFPPYSPDLNPIESLWANLARRVEKFQCDTMEELQDIVAEEWKNTDKELLRKLARSMPERCQAVIDAKGDHTPF